MNIKNMENYTNICTNMNIIQQSVLSLTWGASNLAGTLLKYSTTTTHSL